MSMQQRNPLTEFNFKPIEIFTPDNSLRVIGHASEQAFGNEIKILVWNVFKAKRQNWFSDFVRLRLGQDLIVLQEAVLNSRHDHLFSEDQLYEWVLGRSFRQRHSGLETGVKTGAITPPITARSIFSTHREPFSRTPKIVLSTRYRLHNTDDLLLVLNVHAINFVSIRKYEHQLGQLLIEIDQHQGPVIMAGDFNTWRARRCDLFQNIASKMRLHEATMKQPARQNLFPRQLDHVYYRGLKLEHIKLFDDVTSSDHHPISALFSR